MLRRRLDIYELALHRHIRNATRQRLGGVAEWLVVEVAAVTKGAVRKRHWFRLNAGRFLVALIEFLPRRLVGHGADILILPEVLQYVGQIRQRHRLLIKRKNFFATGCAREKRIVSFLKIVAILALRVTELKNVSVAQFFDYVVGEFARRSQALNVSRRDEEVQLLDIRRGATIFSNIPGSRLV